MTSPTVTYESSENIAAITLNRPERLNALNSQLVKELEQAWLRFEDSDDRVAILGAAGDRAFSAGADLQDNPMDLYRAIPNVAIPLSKPVIAAVHGHCIGGGYVIAQHCDLIVAAEDTKFMYPEARVGFTGGIAAGVAARVPHKFAMEFLLLGETIDAQHAYEMGMVNRVLPKGKHTELAFAWARRIADSAPLVIQTLKDFADRSLVHSPAEDSARTRRDISLVTDSADRYEGAAAALEKRDPQWIGA